MLDTIASFTWNETTIALLRERWNRGDTATEIAAEFSEAYGPVSRSAILGKVHRLGLAGRLAKGCPKGPRAGAAAVAKAKAASKPAAAAEAPPPAPREPVPQSPVPIAPLVPPRLVASTPEGGVPFLEIKAFRCRYIVAGEGMLATCCGKPQERGSYCAAHGRLIYAGTPTREERKIAADLQRRGAA